MAISIIVLSMFIGGFFMTEEQYEELEDYADEQKEEIAEELSEGLIIPGE